MSEETTMEVVEHPEKESVAPEKVATPAQRAEAHIRLYTLAAAGTGMLPVPGLDLAGIAGLQCRLVQLIAREYGVGFRENGVKTVIASLLGSVGASRLFAAPLFSLLKAVPIVGTALSGMTLSGVAAASTYALGKVFVQHFETGGTLLNFDAKKISGYYAAMFDEGKLKAADYLKEKAETAEKQPAAV